MRKFVGVWIDHEKACLVALDEQGSPSATHLESGVEARIKPHGGKRGIGGTPQNQIDGRRREHLHRYYQQVMNSLGSCEQVRLFGPGLARKELQSVMMEHHDLAQRLVGSEKVDSMTTSQFVALVQNAFELTPRRRH